MPETQSPFRNYPFDVIPFEAFYHGSWHGVDCMSIKNGSIFAEFNFRESVVEESINTDHIRLHSRKARAFDCLHHLKPGVDVCVLSAHPTSVNSGQEFQEALSWYDAKIISIKRVPHENRCTCLFSVMVYRIKAPTILGKSSLDRWAEVVTIDNIAILQTMNSKPCGDGYYQWSSSEDCTNSSKSKLLSGTFSSEISWLVVLSTLKGFDFDVKIEQNKIVHHVLNNELDNGITIVRFQICGENLKPEIANIVPVLPEERNVPERTIVVDLIDSKLDSDSDVEILYDHMKLRHSKRRKVAPDRFFSSFPSSSVRNKTHGMNRLERERTIAHPESCPERSKCNMIQSSSKHGETKSSAVEQETICGNKKIDIKSRMKLKTLWRRVKKQKEVSPSEDANHLFSRRGQKKCSHRRKLLTAEECKQMMETWIGNIKSEMKRETQHVPQWTENQPIDFPKERLDFNWSPSSESPDENDELGVLWMEMEHSLNTLALLEKKQESNSEFFTGPLNNLDNDVHEPCQHDYKLNEKIGHVCQKCNFISEIRYVMPPFWQGDDWDSRKEKFADMENSCVGPNNYKLDPCSEDSSWEISNLEGHNNVWSVVPVIRSRLRLHQKIAFEFIWRNIAGSLKPEEMNHLSEDAGGCVISHAPGSGKTLLIISFLISYLKLFPNIRPLVLCPKIAVYVWCKELEKWGFPFPVHQIYPAESFKKEMWNSKTSMLSIGKRKPSLKSMHIMDCLMKFQQWHEHPSVLLMSYPSFSSLAREDSGIEYRKFMARTLRRSPGILILDEGHNPRSTRAKSRKLLMKVNTKFRILLSGTLFQNNFEEYFNTLALARPCFINDVISKLDPKMLKILSIKQKKRGKKVNPREKLARKLFVEKIGQKIESSMEYERKQGFELLDRITSGFVNTFEGDMSDTLPGLQIYVLLLKSSDLQQEVLGKLQDLIIKHKRCPLELEYLISFGTIHPWLVKTVARVGEYFNADELEKIEKYKGNFASGSKAKFVIDLVHKSCGRGERVLIFCHHLSPIDLLVELLENVFSWIREEEILVLKGTQELSVRAKIMDKFNGDKNGRCKVLLASTAACSEGINLVAASRVILLDSEWNHAKTRQAIARAFRPGQERVVYVYRLVASETWEEEKYDSNEWKSWLAKMIFIGSYYKYSPPREVEDVDDEILKELVEENSQGIFRKILKHDEVVK